MANPTIGMGPALFLIFLVLKLTDNIDWSWWWVTSPLWVLVALSFLSGLLVALLSHPK